MKCYYPNGSDKDTAMVDGSIFELVRAYVRRPFSGQWSDGELVGVMSRVCQFWFVLLFLGTSE